MAIWHEEKKHCFIIRLEEPDLNDKMIDRMRQLLTVAFLNKQFNIVLDLSMCKLIDSYFIGLIITTHNDIKNLGGKMCCAGAHGQIARAFDAIRLNQIMEMHDTLESAVESCNPAKSAASSSD